MEWPATETTEPGFDPLDMVEMILTEEQLEYERTLEGDICFSIPGSWKPFEMWFTWHEPGEALQLCGALGVAGLEALSRERRLELYELLALINQRVWFGHFEVYQEEGGLTLSPGASLEKRTREALASAGVGAVGPKSADAAPEPAQKTAPKPVHSGLDLIFRHALAVSSAEHPSMVQTAHMVNRAAEAMDGFYPAFDFWLKGGITAAQALEACLFETVGEA
jgi:hypothetical protein